MDSGLLFERGDPRQRQGSQFRRITRDLRLAVAFEVRHAPVDCFDQLAEIVDQRTSRARLLRHGVSVRGFAAQHNA